MKSFNVYKIIIVEKTVYITKCNIDSLPQNTWRYKAIPQTKSHRVNYLV